MLSMSVMSDLEKAVAKLKVLADAQNRVTEKNFNYAVAAALTKTAKDIQEEVRKGMPMRFTIRRRWVIQNIRIKPANKRGPMAAEVYSGDDFMGLQEFGGTKNARGRYVAIPTSAVRRTKTQIIRKSDRPKNLGDSARVIDVHGEKYLALTKGREHDKRRKAGHLRLMYLLIPAANLKERLGLTRTGQRRARQYFQRHFRDMLDQVIKQAR